MSKEQTLKAVYDCIKDEPINRAQIAQQIGFSIKGVVPYTDTLEIEKRIKVVFRKKPGGNHYIRTGK